MLKWGYLFIFLIDTSYCSFLSWLGFHGESATPITFNNIPLIKVPFEELDPEEKFLVEASKITGLKLDELDACQQKLVVKLKTSCGDLSDEELSKLAVGLLNCQSHVEGRKVFTCSPEMSLRECTREMDPDTWNSYHVISNRARAVCYSVRQDQFRALAEMTVNKLMTITQEHIQKMANIEDKQKQLEQSTQEIFNRFLKTEAEILAAFGNLKKSESSLLASVTFNLNKTKSQSELLTKFDKTITKIMEEFQLALDNSGNQLYQQMETNLEQHTSLQNSLAELSKTTMIIAKTLRESSLALQAREDEIMSKSMETINRLRSINDSVTNLASWLEYLEQIGRPRYQQVKELIGDKGDRLDLLLVISGHLSCLLFAMLICSFLSVPFTSRWLLLLSASVNTYFATTAKLQEYSSPLFLFYIGILVCILGDYCGRFFYKKYRRNGANKYSNVISTFFKNKKNEDTLIKTNNAIDKTYYNNIGDEINNKVNSWLSGRYAQQINGHVTPKINHINCNNNEDYSDTNTEYSLSKKLPNSPASVGGSSSVKTRCSAICKTGIPCRNQAYANSTRCRVHIRGPSEGR